MINHQLNIPHIFPIYSPYIPHIFPIYSPYIPHIFPIYSPYLPRSPRNSGFPGSPASNQAVDRLKAAALLMHEASLVGVLHFAFPDHAGLGELKDRSLVFYVGKTMS